MSVNGRRFVDDVGVAWQVWEVTNPVMPKSLDALLGNDRRRGGWLVFESETGEKRRLAPYPADWTTVTDFEIARWCQKAVKVPPAPSRREQDP